MRRLSVLTVTRNRSRRSSSMGCSAMDAAAPVWTFEVGHISSGTRRSRTKPASGHGPLASDLEALEVGLDDLIERQALLGRELRRVADLGIGDAVGGEILRALRRDADNRVALLEDADGVLECLEVELKGFPVRATAEPGREVVDIGG